MLLTLGDLVEQIVVEVPSPIRRGHTSSVRTIRVRGGSAANVATLICERGGQARFVGQVGGDAVGRSLVGDLERRGVEVLVRAQGATGVEIELRHDGYRTFFSDRGVAARLKAVKPDVLQGVTQVFVPGRTLLADPLAGVVQELLGAAVKRRLPTTLTVLEADEIEQYGAAAFLGFLAAARPETIISTVRDHAALGLGQDKPVAGAVCTVIVGPELTTVLTAEGLHRRVVTTELAVRDRTGAHDGFVAGYLLSRGAGATALAAVDAGHRVAALVMSQVGPTSVGPSQRPAPQFEPGS